MKKKTLLSKFLISLVRFYKSYISPILPRSCKFHPSCSTYTINAIETYGPLKGVWMGIKRIMKCNPFSKGGYDPVEKSDK